MANKNILWPVIVATMMASAANAECYFRSAISVSGKKAIQRVDDVREKKFPYNGLRKCVVTMRAQIDNQWQDVEGEGVADNYTEACRQAKEFVNLQTLRPTDGVIDTESSMVCSDEPKTTYKTKIKVGDWLKESEVPVFHSFPKPFKHVGSRCKWFPYKETHLGKVVGFAGIMCELRPGEWQVVDLF